MAKEALLEIEGVVTESFKNMFRVEINSETTGTVAVTATLSGKIRQNQIRIVPGDRVKVEVSPYDLKKGRITYRLRD